MADSFSVRPCAEDKVDGADLAKYGHIGNFIITSVVLGMCCSASLKLENPRYHVLFEAMFLDRETAYPHLNPGEDL